MTRLVGEIQASRDDRGRMLRDLKRGTAEMLARFRSAHLDMARRQRPMLREFVAGLRKELWTDLGGARKAWAGAAAEPMPGRAKRGGKSLGGESA
jgi:hypothetical protein